LSQLNIEARASELEILGEKALTQGHIDLLLKQRVPLGSTLRIPIEVKTNRAESGDLAQLRSYMDELLDDCPIGVLVAADFNKQTVVKAGDNKISLVKYRLNTDLTKALTFEEIYEKFGSRAVEWIASSVREIIRQQMTPANFSYTAA
jgi:RecB family endonuclease NucS